MIATGAPVPKKQRVEVRSGSSSSIASGGAMSVDEVPIPQVPIPARQPGVHEGSEFGATLLECLDRAMVSQEHKDAVRGLVARLALGSKSTADTVQRQQHSLKQDLQALVPERVIPKEEVTVGPENLSTRKAPVLSSGSIVFHFPVSPEHQFAAESQAKQAQGSFAWTALLEGFWGGSQAGQWCFTGLAWAHAVNSLHPLLDDTLVWDLFPCVNAARGGGVNCNDPIHQQVVDKGLKAALGRGERAWFVASSQAWRALMGALQRRSAAELGPYEAVDLKAQYRGRKVTTKVVFLPTSGPVVIIGAPHMSLLRMPFLAFSIVRSLFGFLDLLGLPPSDAQWDAVFQVVRGGLASRDEEERAIKDWLQKKCSEEERKKGSRMWEEGHSVWDIYASIFGSRSSRRKVERDLKAAGVAYEEEADLQELVELAAVHDVDIRWFGDLTASEAGCAAADTKALDALPDSHLALVEEHGMEAQVALRLAVQEHGLPHGPGSSATSVLGQAHFGRAYDPAGAVDIWHSMPGSDVPVPAGTPGAIQRTGGARVKGAIGGAVNDDEVERRRKNNFKPGQEGKTTRDLKADGVDIWYSMPGSDVPVPAGTPGAIQRTGGARVKVDIWYSRPGSDVPVPAGTPGAIQRTGGARVKGAARAEAHGGARYPLGSQVLEDGRVKLADGRVVPKDEAISLGAQSSGSVNDGDEERRRKKNFKPGQDGKSTNDLKADGGAIGGRASRKSAALPEGMSVNKMMGTLFLQKCSGGKPVRITASGKQRNGQLPLGYTKYYSKYCEPGDCVLWDVMVDNSNLPLLQEQVLAALQGFNALARLRDACGWPEASLPEKGEWVEWVDGGLSIMMLAP